MKRLAWITSVLLGAATVAQAQPPYNNTYEHHDRYDRSDHDRDDRDQDRRVDEGRREMWSGQRGWVPLAAMDIQRKETVDIGRQAGRFQRLRLQALRGAAYVDFVTVRFGNGHQQHVDVRRRIGRDQSFDIEFGGARRYIDAVTVHGMPDRWSQIRIIGLR